MVICLERDADLHMAQLMPLPLLLAVSCFSKIQIGFTFLVPAHLGSPGERAVKWVCVWLKLETKFCTVVNHIKYKALDDRQPHSIYAAYLTNKVDCIHSANFILLHCFSYMCSTYTKQAAILAPRRIDQKKMTTSTFEFSTPKSVRKQSLCNFTMKCTPDHILAIARQCTNVANKHFQMLWSMVQSVLYRSEFPECHATTVHTHTPV